MSRNSDAYLELASAIVYMATEDYINFNRQYYKLNSKLNKELTNPTILPRRDGETDRHYYQRRKRFSPIRYTNQINNCKTVVIALREFFLGDWIKTLSDVDGQKILEELDNRLEKEGHKIWDLN